MPGTTLFPGAQDSHVGGNPFGFQVLANLLGTSLVGNHSPAATTINAASTTTWESRGWFVLRNPDPLSAILPELCTYTSKNATQFLGVTRGAGGTAAKSWNDGTLIELAPVAAMHDDLAAAIVAMQGKLGISAAASPVDAAAVDLLLIGTAAGRTKFGQAQRGSIAAAAVGRDQIDWTDMPLTVADVPLNQSISSNSLTPVQFNTERIDREGMHDNVTNNTRFTCTVAGWHLFLTQLSFSFNTSSYREGHYLVNNTTQYEGVKAAANGGASTGIFFGNSINLAVGDYVEVRGFHVAGVALTINGGYNIVRRRG